MNRSTFRLLARIPTLTAPVRWLAVHLADRGYCDPVTKRLLFAAQAMEFCRGLHEAGGLPRSRRLRVLAYHAIADSGGAGHFEPYGVRPEDFRQQVTLLRRLGCTFISVEELLHFLNGKDGLPRRPVLLSFDDGYANLLGNAVPVLQEYGIPAVVFAVSDRLGENNDWVHAPGVARMPLLSAEELKRLTAAGLEIGAHSRTHPRLPLLADPELEEEVGGSCRVLRQLGLGNVRTFAYPYGECSERVQQAVERSGCSVGFTVQPGFVRSRSDPFRVPRIEILREDVGWRFLFKVASGGLLPFGGAIALDGRRRRRQRWSRIIPASVRRSVLTPARSLLRAGSTSKSGS
jgi:peptidoglycan/xylan/chitin deacetylase (PgdA/CDA1 family)